MFIGNMKNILKISLTDDEYSYFINLLIINVFGIFTIDYCKELFVKKIGLTRYKILKEKIQLDFMNCYLKKS